MAEPVGVLHVGDRVMFEAAEHEVVALTGTAVRLQATSGQVSVVALPFLLGSPGFLVIGVRLRRGLDPVGLLDGLPPTVVEAARRWQEHLEELETGLHPSAAEGTAPRSEYDPRTWTVTQREQSKAAELGVGVRTVRRMRRRYREQGVWGLVDTRKVRKSSMTGRVDERVVAAARAVVNAQTSTSTGTKSRAWRQVEARLEAEHGAGVVPMPSRATAYRLLEALATGHYTFGSAVTRRQTADRPDAVFTAVVAARPGEQVQMDGTTLDVMAVMDDGVLDRPELVMAVDVATRTICAAVLRPEKAKAVDAALLLARMMVPEPMRPSWDQVLRMSASRLPFARLVDIDRRLELVAAKPVIVPETIVIDHGRVFVSEAFTRAARTLGSRCSRHGRRPAATSRTSNGPSSRSTRCSASTCPATRGAAKVSRNPPRVDLGMRSLERFHERGPAIDDGPQTSTIRDRPQTAARRRRRERRRPRRLRPGRPSCRRRSRGRLARMARLRPPEHPNPPRAASREP